MRGEVHPEHGKEDGAMLITRPISTLAGKDIARFWTKVQRGDGCWLWTGTLNDAGYGLIKLGRKEFRASRIMLLLDGRNPEGKLALHRCDNPACVNPAHLFLGTHEDNMADCKQKGRGAHQVYPGESNPKAKLSAAQVQEIRRSPESYQDLAVRFGMTKENIGAIKKGKTWKCLPWT
jgi:hypothetical protein